MAYQVKKGDTLAGLYGPNWKIASGYTGDPTKLQIGTELPDLPTQLRSPSVMPNVPNPQIADIQKQIAEKQSLLGQAQTAGYTGSQPILSDVGTQKVAPAPQDMSTAIQNELAKYGVGKETLQTPADRQKEYLDFITGQRTAGETQLGIPGQETTAKNLQTQIDTTNKLLDDLEMNINERVKGLGAGESWRNRMLAYERQPLTRQLGELGQAYAPVAGGLATSRQKLSEMMGTAGKAFEYGQELSPQEKLAQKIAEQQALQAIKPPSYTQVSPGETLYDPKTGKAIYTGPAKPTEPKYQEVQGGLYDITNQKWIIQPKATMGKTDMTSYLAKQGIPLTVATSAGELTNTSLNKVVSALGGNLELADTIWGEMKKNKSFEEIRQMMKEANLDISILDKFVQALQGTSTGGGKIKNPWE